MRGGHGDELEAWRTAVKAREAREQAVDELVTAAIRAELDATLSWAQVDDVLTGLGYGEEPDLADLGDGLISPAEETSEAQRDFAVSEPS